MGIRIIHIRIIQDPLVFVHDSSHGLVLGFVTAKAKNTSLESLWERKCRIDCVISFLCFQNKKSHSLTALKEKSKHDHRPFRSHFYALLLPQQNAVLGGRTKVLWALFWLRGNFGPSHGVLYGAVRKRVWCYFPPVCTLHPLVALLLSPLFFFRRMPKSRWCKESSLWVHWVQTLNHDPSHVNR